MSNQDIKTKPTVIYTVTERDADGNENMEVAFATEALAVEHVTQSVIAHFLDFELIEEDKQEEGSDILRKEISSTFETLTQYYSEELEMDFIITPVSFYKS